MQSRVVLLLLAVLGVFSDPYSDLRFLSSDVGSTYSGSGDQSGDYTITPQPPAFGDCASDYSGKHLYTVLRSLVSDYSLFYCDE